jgi:acyl phosphate:glycerol-3-phosphate acyltransferase
MPRLALFWAICSQSGSGSRVARAFAAIWLGTAYLSRYSSLSALVATAATPVLLLLLSKPQEALVFLVLGLLLYWKHLPNIRRLLAGTEGRIGAKG